MRIGLLSAKSTLENTDLDLPTLRIFRYLLQLQPQTRQIQNTLHWVGAGVAWCLLSSTNIEIIECQPAPQNLFWHLTLSCFLSHPANIVWPRTTEVITCNYAINSFPIREITHKCTLCYKLLLCQLENKLACRTEVKECTKVAEDLKSPATLLTCIEITPNYNGYSICFHGWENQANTAPSALFSMQTISTPAAVYQQGKTLHKRKF